MSQERDKANAAIVSLCKALGQIIANEYVIFDRTTGSLMSALADWVREHEPCKE